MGYIFDLITSRCEKHVVPEISLLDRKSLHFLSLEVPIFCNRDPRPVARAGIPTRAAVFCAKMVFKGGSAWKVSNLAEGVFYLFCLLANNAKMFIFVHIYSYSLPKPNSHAMVKILV